MDTEILVIFITIFCCIFFLALIRVILMFINQRNIVQNFTDYTDM